MIRRLAELTWEENRDLIRDAVAVLIPVGSTEQHGPHLPVNTDAFCAGVLAWRIVEEADRQGIWAGVAPAIVFGVSGHHMSFPGTIALSPRLFEDLSYEVASSLLKHGWRAVVFVNGHGGNSAALSMAAARLAEAYPRAVILVHEWWQLIADRLGDILEGDVCHACEGETSLSMALGQRVIGDRARPEMPRIFPKLLRLGMRETAFRVGFPPPRFDRITRSGVLGDPTKASVPKGEAIVREIISRSVLLLRELVAERSNQGGERV